MEPIEGLTPDEIQALLTELGTADVTSMLASPALIRDLLTRAGEAISSLASELDDLEMQLSARTRFVATLKDGERRYPIERLFDKFGFETRDVSKAVIVETDGKYLIMEDTWTVLIEEVAS